MKLRAAAAFWLAAYSSLCLAQTRYSATQIFTKIKDSVVVIVAGKQEDKSPSAQGSGFVIAKNQVVTNFHVVSGMDIAVVAFQDGRSELVEGALFYDADEDLIVLSVPTGAAPPIPLGDELSLRQGQHVLALGAPEGLNLSLTDGIISSFRKVEGTFMIQSTAPISHGSSGGPLLNERGQAVGITTLGLNNAAGIYFSVGVSALKQLLKSQSSGLTKLDDLPQPAEENAEAAPAGQSDPTPPATAVTQPSATHAVQPPASSPAHVPATVSADQGPIQNLLNQKRFAEARALIDDALTKGIENAGLLRQKALVEWEFKNYANASRYFERSISLDPSDAETRMDYTGLLVDGGEWDRALVQAEALNRLSPGTDARRFLAIIYYFAHRYPDARIMAETVLAAVPNDVSALKVLAGIAYWSVPFDGAAWRQYVDALQKVEPDAIWVHLSSALAKHRNDPAGAFAELDLAAKDQFPESAPFLLASSFHVQAHDFKEADQSIKSGLAMNGHDLAMLRQAVWVSLLNHHELEAGRYIETMKKIVAPTPEELDGAACLYYYRINDVSQALSYCQDEIQYRPRNPGAYTNYGWALFDAGKFKEARQQFERGESLRNPNQSMQREALVDAQWAMILGRYYTGDRQGASSMLKALRASDPPAVDFKELKKLALVLSEPTLKHIHEVLKSLN